MVTQNDALAVQRFEKAANQGYPSSQHSLGLKDANGRGVEQDWQQAMQCYLKAAEQNYDKSMVNLGNCYTDGTRVEYDKQKALYWYQKGAELGNRMAQHHLADLYLNGYVKNKNEVLERLKQAGRHRRVQKDEAKARYWFEKSAQQGYAEAQYKLAKLYIAENERFRRDAEAIQLLKKTGKQRIAEAYTIVGMAYINGRGIAGNRVKAAYYLLRAFKGGHLDAGKFLLPCILPVSVM